MGTTNRVTRRQFTLQSALAILSGVAITLSGCDDSNPSSPTSPTGPTTPGPTDDATGVVAANHGHSAVIMAAQLTAGGAISLDIRGAATHSHTVELTEAEVQQIGTGTRVSKDSSTDASHRHTVTFD